MIQIHPQFVVDENLRRKAVILSYEEWEKILADMEELDDIRAYDTAKANNDDIIPFEQAVKEIRQGIVS